MIVNNTKAKITFLRECAKHRKVVFRCILKTSNKPLIKRKRIFAVVNKKAL